MIRTLARSLALMPAAALLVLLLYGCSSPTTAPMTRDLSSRVTGVVRDSASGAPLRDVKVTALPAARGASAGRAPSPAVTDAEGRYAMTNLADGNYNFRFEMADQTYQAVEVALNVAGTVKSLSVTMIPASIPPPASISLTFPPPGTRVGRTAKFTGTASSGGRDLAVFWTVAPKDGGPMIGRVNADGLFTATSPGVGIVKAQIGPTTATAQITVLDNITAGGIFGVVVDGQGGPVAGASVSGAAGTATTAVDGTFTLPDVSPGTYDVTAAKGGLSGGASAAVEANKVAAVQIQVR